MGTQGFAMRPDNSPPRIAALDLVLRAEAGKQIGYRAAKICVSAECHCSSPKPETKMRSGRA